MLRRACELCVSGLGYLAICSMWTAPSAWDALRTAEGYRSGTLHGPHGAPLTPAEAAAWRRLLAELQAPAPGPDREPVRDPPRDPARDTTRDVN
jgi:hypothetical protein